MKKEQAIKDIEEKMAKLLAKELKASNPKPDIGAFYCP